VNVRNYLRYCLLDTSLINLSNIPPAPNFFRYTYLIPLEVCLGQAPRGRMPMCSYHLLAQSRQVQLPLNLSYNSTGTPNWKPHHKRLPILTWERRLRGEGRYKQKARGMSRSSSANLDCHFNNFFTSPIHPQSSIPFSHCNVTQVSFCKP
jgi:hypothetical protein